MIRKTIIPIIFLLLLLLILTSSGCVSEGGDSDSIIWGRARSVGTDIAVSNLRFSLDGINIFGVTDDTGFFTVEGVPEGEYNARFIYQGIMVSRLTFSITKEQALNGETVQIMWPGPFTGDEEFSGVVTDIIGAPLPDARVMISRPDKNIQITTTNEFGAYSFTSLPEGGEYTVIVSLDGYESGSQILTLSAGMVDRVNFQLGEKGAPILPWGSVSGMVIDENGVELPGVYVAVYPKNVVNPLLDTTGETVTDFSGSFAFSQVIEGPYVLWIGRSGDGVKIKEVFITAGMAWEGKIVLDGKYAVIN